MTEHQQTIMAAVAIGGRLARLRTLAQHVRRLEWGTDAIAWESAISRFLAEYDEMPKQMRPPIRLLFPDA